jgi:hypothetical protein
MVHPYITAVRDKSVEPMPPIPESATAKPPMKASNVAAATPSKVATATPSTSKRSIRLERQHAGQQETGE